MGTHINTANIPAFLYVLSNHNNTTLYIGSVSCNKFYAWYQRLKYQPKTFDAPYIFEKLVYFEMFAQSSKALRREKQLKALSRIMQRRLVTDSNTGWENLLEGFVQEMEQNKPA